MEGEVAFVAAELLPLPPVDVVAVCIVFDGALSVGLCVTTTNEVTVGAAEPEEDGVEAEVACIVSELLLLPLVDEVVVRIVSKETLSVGVCTITRVLVTKREKDELDGELACVAAEQLSLANVVVDCIVFGAPPSVGVMLMTLSKRFARSVTSGIL